MSKKRSQMIAIASLAVMLSLALANITYAADTALLQGTQDIAAPAAVAEQSAVKENSDLELKNLQNEKSRQRAIARGEKLINERIAALTNLSRKFTKEGTSSIPTGSPQKMRANNKLRGDQPTILVSQINAAIAALNRLKIELNAQNDVPHVKEVINRIYTENRIYAVLIPKLNLQASLMRQENYLARVKETTFPRVEYRVNQMQAKVNDEIAFLAKSNKSTSTRLTSYKKSLATRQAALNEVKATTTPAIARQIAASKAKVEALKPADYPKTSAQIINTVNKEIKAIHKSILNMLNTLKRAN